MVPKKLIYQLYLCCSAVSAEFSVSSYRRLLTYAHCGEDSEDEDLTKIHDEDHYDTGLEVCLKCGSFSRVFEDFPRGREMRCCPKSKNFYDLRDWNGIDDSCSGINPNSGEACQLMPEFYFVGTFSNSQIICDGIKNCPGGLDEINCSNSNCNNNQFSCDNFQTCFDLSKICDGIKNCRDGSDEMNCMTSRGLCKINEFTCGSRFSNSELCLPKSQICDGTKDCPDGQDEVNCDVARVETNNSKFQCRNGQLISSSQVCSDFGSICGDNSDMINCYKWYHWTEWLDQCPLICKRTRTRKCYNMVTQMEDVTTSKCPRDSSDHNNFQPNNIEAYAKHRDKR